MVQNSLFHHYFSKIYKIEYPYIIYTYFFYVTFCLLFHQERRGGQSIESPEANVVDFVKVLLGGVRGSLDEPAEPGPVDLVKVLLALPKGQTAEKKRFILCIYNIIEERSACRQLVAVVKGTNKRCKSAKNVVKLAKPNKI